MTVEQYWGKSDDELYALLGAELLGEGLGLSDDDEDDCRRFGKEWFAKKHRELQRTICHHDRVRPFIGTTGSDRLLDAAAIYEALQHAGEDVTTAAVLAVLVARVGLGSFCQNAPEPG